MRAVKYLKDVLTWLVNTEGSWCQTTLKQGDNHITWLWFIKTEYSKNSYKIDD